MNAPRMAFSDPPWRSPPETLALGHDEIHVWQANLDQPPSQLHNFFHKLAADEQARAARFYFARDREHFIVARGVLRAILGCYLNCTPESLSFRYGSHGKPALAGETGETIRFNVSHSHGIGLYAVTRGWEVGIDLERIRFDLPVAEITERFFSKSEVAMFRSLPTEAQHQAFFRWWARKEAYIKALGEGLSLPLNQFDLPAFEEQDTVLGTQRDQSEASRWSLHELTATPGFAAALAVKAHGWRLSCWQWPDAMQHSA